VRHTQWSIDRSGPAAPKLPELIMRLEWNRLCVQQAAQSLGEKLEQASVYEVSGIAASVDQSPVLNQWQLTGIPVENLRQIP
jgi:hypothetical protein